MSVEDGSGASAAMRIPRALLDEMIAHAQADAPNECCGLLAARGDDAVRVHRAENAAASPLKFVIDPGELYRLFSAIEDSGCRLGAIYHSHTRTEPYPSQTDINFAAGWPGVSWLIIGVAAGEASARIYEIRDGEVVEQPLQVQ